LTNYGYHVPLISHHGCKKKPLGKQNKLLRVKKYIKKNTPNPPTPSLSPSPTNQSWRRREGGGMQRIYYFNKDVDGVIEVN